MGIKKLIRLQYQLEQLYNRYATLLNDGPLEEWPTLFCEECFYAVTPRENFEADLPLAIMRCESRAMLEDRIYSVQKTMVYEPRYIRHHITNVQILDENKDLIRTTANYTVIETLTDELPKILNSGKYLDKIILDEGEFRFKEKYCIYDSVLVPNSIIYPV
jgi:3-phenylpropionate/cinnamic acid dioxygenase small subunit